MFSAVGCRSHSPQMELSQIKTFTVVARYLSFTRASKNLGLTQPAVSHQIKALEADLGIKLFRRDKQKISLTPEGRLVLDYAQKMLGQIDLMHRDIANHDKDLKGTVRLTAITRSMGNPFLELRSVWQSINKDIELVFESALMSDSIIEKVRKREADIGFSTLTDDFPGLASIPWGAFELALVVGTGHPLAKAKSVGLEELIEQKWILFEQGSWLRRESDKIFDRYGFSPKDLYESNDGGVVLNLIKDGFGIGLMPAWGIWNEVSAGSIKAVKIDGVDVVIELKLIILEEGRPAHVDIFLEFLLENEFAGIRKLSTELRRAIRKEPGV